MEASGNKGIAVITTIGYSKMFASVLKLSLGFIFITEIVRIYVFRILKMGIFGTILKTHQQIKYVEYVVGLQLHRVVCFCGRLLWHVFVRDAGLTTFTII